MPVPKKVDAIQAIEVPKTKRELRKFIGMVNYYRDMWKKRSHILAPLTKLSSKLTSGSGPKNARTYLMK